MHGASHVPSPTRILIVANGDVGDPDVAALVPGGARPENLEVLVVAPALNTFLGRRVATPAAAERDAERRIVLAVLALSAAGVRTTGIVGDADPLFAIEDAVSVFAADEVVIAVDPDGADGWLGARLAERARGRLGIPVRAPVPTAGAWAPVAA